MRGCPFKCNNNCAVLLGIQHLRPYTNTALSVLVGICTQRLLKQQKSPNFFWFLDIYAAIPTIPEPALLLYLGDHRQANKTCKNLLFFSRSIVNTNKKKMLRQQPVRAFGRILPAKYAGYIKRLLTYLNFLQTRTIYSIIIQFSEF